jgi:hypothetical protein
MLSMWHIVVRSSKRHEMYIPPSVLTYRLSREPVEAYKNLIFGAVVWFVETLEFWLKSDKNKGILYSKTYMRVCPDLQRVIFRAKVVKHGSPNVWWQRAKPVTMGWAQCGKWRVIGTVFMVYTQFTNLAVGSGLKNEYFNIQCTFALAPTVCGIIKHDNDVVPLLRHANTSRLVCR